MLVKKQMQPSLSQPSLSIVVPAFNEEANIPLLHQRLTATLKEIGLSYEIILIDDGSYDGTFDVIRRLAKDDRRVKGLHFSRNFGSHAAITAGYKVACGDAAIMVSADGQEPLEMLPLFVEKWRQGYDIVWGVRQDRNDPILIKVTSLLFNWLMSKLVSLPSYPRRGGTAFTLLDRKVIDILQQLPERNRSIIGLTGWIGFKQAEIPCQFGSRRFGSSRWTTAKKIKLAIDTIVSFSYLPLRITSALGMIISGLSFIYAAVIVFKSIAFGVSVAGWPTLMVTVLFLGGVQLIALGVIGEYVWRALDESRQRPLYIVSETVGFSETEAAKLGVVAHSVRDGAPQDPSTDGSSAFQ